MCMIMVTVMLIYCDWLIAKKPENDQIDELADDDVSFSKMYTYSVCAYSVYVCMHVYVCVGVRACVRACVLE